MRGWTSPRQARPIVVRAATPRAARDRRRSSDRGGVGPRRIAGGRGRAPARRSRIAPEAPRILATARPARRSGRGPRSAADRPRPPAGLTRGRAGGHGPVPGTWRHRHVSRADRRRGTERVFDDRAPPAGTMRRRPPVGRSRRGPARAPAAVKASSARVGSSVRGTASVDTVTRTSRGELEVGPRRTSIRAAPAADTRGPGPWPGTRTRSRSRCRHPPRRSLRAVVPPSRASLPGVERQLDEAATDGAPTRSATIPSRLCSAERADGRFGRSAQRRSAARARSPRPSERHVPAWPSTRARNSSSSPSTPPGCSATSSARKRARSGPTAAAT